MKISLLWMLILSLGGSLFGGYIVGGQGDLDDDGDIDTDDLQALIDQIEGRASRTPEGDVNRDGELDLLDLEALRQLLEPTRRVPFEGEVLVSLHYTDVVPLIDGASETLWEETVPWIFDPDDPTQSYHFKEDLGAGPHDDFARWEVRLRWGAIGQDLYLFGFISTSDAYVETDCQDADEGRFSDGCPRIVLASPSLRDRGADGVFEGGLNVLDQPYDDMQDAGVFHAVSVEGTLDDSTTGDDTGYHLEFAIPFRLFAFDGSAEEFRDEIFSFKIEFVDHDLSPAACRDDTTSLRWGWAGGTRRDDSSVGDDPFDLSLFLQLGYRDPQWIWEERSAFDATLEATDLWVDEKPDASPQVIVATGPLAGTSPVACRVLHSSDAGRSFRVLASLPGRKAHSLTRFQESLFVGTGGADEDPSFDHRAHIYRLDEGPETRRVERVYVASGGGDSAILDLHVFAGHVYALMGEREYGEDAVLLRSGDGETWTQVLDLGSLSAEPLGFVSKLASDDLTLMMTSTEGRVFVSADGTQWSEEVVDPAVMFESIVSWQGAFYLGGTRDLPEGPIAIIYRRNAALDYEELFRADVDPFGGAVLIDDRRSGVQHAWESFSLGAVLDETSLLFYGDHCSQAVLWDGATFTALRSVCPGDRERYSDRGFSLSKRAIFALRDEDTRGSLLLGERLHYLGER